MINASDVEATLQYLVPGFVALKVFYVFGLKTKRTDLEWTLWSLVGAALIDVVVSALNPADTNQRLEFALIVAMVAGALLTGGWYVAKGWPWLRAESSRQAWDWALSVPQWVNVWTTCGEVVFGNAYVVASSAETDQLDIYIQDPYRLDVEHGIREPMTNVAGLWMSESQIQMIQVVGERTETAEEQAAIVAPHRAPLAPTDDEIGGEMGE